MHVQYIESEIDDRMWRDFSHDVQYTVLLLLSHIWHMLWKLLYKDTGYYYYASTVYIFYTAALKLLYSTCH